MNKIISILVQNEDYELEVAIRKVAKNETSQAEKLAKASKYIWPHDDTHDGSPIDTEKLLYRPNFQNHCPV